MSKKKEKQQTSRPQYQASNLRLGIKFLIFTIFFTVVYIVYSQSEEESSSNLNCDPSIPIKKVIINTDRKVESKIVKNYFKNKCGYKVINKYYYKKTPDDFYLHWAHFYWDVEWNQLIEHQNIISHVPNAELYDDKNGILQYLRKLDKKKPFAHFNSTMFLPKTYMFTIHDETYNIEEKQLFSLVDKGQTWIAKNPNGCCGRGIKLVSNLTQFRNEIASYKNGRGNKQEFRYKQIQEYISNPWLIEGRKAEYRAYVLIASTKPFLILFHKGFLKRALSTYSNDTNDRFAHLTNLAENAKSEEFDDLKQETYYNVTGIEHLLITDKNFGQKDIDNFYHRIKQILTYTFQSGYKDMTAKVGLFDTMAVDIMFDEDINPYLLEVNQPFAVEYAELIGYRDVCPPFLESTLDIVLKLNEDTSKIGDLLQNPEENLPLGEYFSVLLNDQTGYNYIQASK